MVNFSQWAQSFLQHVQHQIIDSRIIPNLPSPAFFKLLSCQLLFGQYLRYPHTMKNHDGCGSRIGRHPVYKEKRFFLLTLIVVTLSL